MVIKSLQLAFNALFKFKTWFLVLLPPFVAGFILCVLFLWNWNTLSLSAAGLLGQWAWIEWLATFSGFPEVFTSIFASTVLVLLFIPVLFVVVLLVTSIFVTPLVQREVALRHFQSLEKKRGGSNVGSLWNSLKSLTIFVVLFMLTFPLWLIPGLQLLVPAILIIWLNKKIFLYDVLQDFASKEERMHIAKTHSLELWGLGGLLVVFSYLPLAFIILPVFSAFAYSFFALNALQRLRHSQSARI